METIAKFKCVEFTQMEYGNKVKFNVVTGNSEENKKFFYLTPYGTIEFGTINPNIIFTPGKEYTVTFSE